MTPTRLRAVLLKLDLSQVAGAHLVGADPRTMRRWCSGELPVAPAAERLLRLLDQVPEMLPVAQEIAANREPAEASVFPSIDPTLGLLS